MSYDPELYALVHCGTPGDVAFYTDGRAKTDAVLELGCGYGRLLPAVAARVKRYVGVELSEGMLRLAERQKASLPAEVSQRVQLMQGDMCTLALEEEFDCVLLPYSGLYCLADESQMAQCLGVARKHLAADGLLLGDVYYADEFHQESRPEDLPDDHQEPVARVSSGDCSYDVYERSHWDRDAQRMVVTYAYNDVNDGTLQEGVIEHHYLLADQLRRLLQQAGFSQIEFSGGFNGEPLQDTDVLSFRATPG